MSMQEHILAALSEQLERWLELLATLDDDQVTAPRFDLGWSIKDVIAHLWAWQQVSVARLEAALRGDEPRLPAWCGGVSGDWEEDADRANACICETFHRMP
jgi:hypothetical protein